MPWCATQKRLNVVCYENRSRCWGLVAKIRLPNLSHWSVYSVSASLFAGREVVFLVWSHSSDGFRHGFWCVYAIDTVTFQLRELSTLPKDVTETQRVAIVGLFSSTLLKNKAFTGRYISLVPCSTYNVKGFV